MSDQSESIHDYLEALLGRELDPWDFRKAIRECARRAKIGTKKVQALELKDVTLEGLDREIKKTKEFVKGAKRRKAIIPGGLDRIIKEAQARKELFENIRAGAFDDQPSKVFVRSPRSLGSYHFGGQNFQIKDMTISFPMDLEGDSYPMEWACIMVLPIWYDYWKGRKSLIQ